MQDQSGRPGSLFSTCLKSAGPRTYFFDIRPTKTQNTFLQITESRPRNGDEDGFDQNRIFLFSEDFDAFFASLREVFCFLKEHPEVKSPPGRRPPRADSHVRNASRRGTTRAHAPAN